MNEKWEIQKKRIRNVSLKLREKYYAEARTECCYFDSPHGIAGNMTESIGSWPEFIFRGTFCKRTFKGYCSPCFYSQFSIENKETGVSYYEMIRKQFDYVINNFDELVVKRQYGTYENNYITFVLTPTGSFFDNKEFPQSLRIEMLDKLLQKSKQYDKEFHLLVECHCKDWNEMNFSLDYTKQEMQLLKLLNTRVLFGFESSGEYARNVLYNKNIEMDEFLRAYRKVEEQGLSVGIFIFAGLFSMNDALTIKDVSNSICFALDRNISPVIMFQNVQQHTITEVLYRKNEINLIEPFTVMEIILCLFREFEKRGKEQEEWLIADPKGGPPIPEFNIFDCAKITSKENADKIYEMVHNLRLTRDSEKFKLEASKLKMTENYSDYQKMLKNCFVEEYLIKNTDRLLDCAEDIVSEMR